MRRRRAAVIVLASLVAACTHRVPRIGPGADVWNSNALVGVAVVRLPEPTTYKHGQQGLVDLVINEAAASGLKAHLATLDVRAFQEAAEEITSRLQRRGVKALRLDEPIDPERFRQMRERDDAERFAERDYSPLARRFGIERLVLLHLASVGTARHYYGFIPTSTPKAYARATAQMIDLRTGALLWSAASERRRDIAGEWDDPPHYPALDRAIAETLHIVARDLANDLAF